MILVPVGYLGYVYWDKHHRGRSSRRQQRHQQEQERREGDDPQQQQQQQGNIITNTPTHDRPEEPPSFQAFLQEYLFQKDSGDFLQEADHRSNIMANAVIAELSSVVGGTDLCRMQQDEFRIALSSSSSSFDSSSIASCEQHHRTVDEQELLRIKQGQHLQDERSSSCFPVVVVVDGLEYELAE